MRPVSTRSMRWFPIVPVTWSGAVDGDPLVRRRRGERHAGLQRRRPVRDLGAEPGEVRDERRARRIGGERADRDARSCSRA